MSLPGGPERDADKARATEAAAVVAAWEDARWRLVAALQDPALAPWDKSGVQRRLARCSKQLQAAQGHLEQALAQASRKPQAGVTYG